MQLPQVPLVPLVPDEKEFAPEELHPALWRATQLARPGSSVCPSHHAALDAVLPGGGWPARELTELLLPHAGVGELRLLAPVLATLQGQQRSVMWFDPPAAPCAWALGALGIDVRQLVVVQSRGGQTAARPAGPLGDRQAQAQVHPGDRPRGRARAVLPAADILWALEQALKSGHLGAVLAWLPARLPADALRRLQLAAQAHDGPAFLLRDAQMRSKPSAAPLRLLLGSAGPDLLRVAVLKRRGPPLAQPLTLALPPVLSAPALARAQQLAGTVAAASPAVMPGAMTTVRRALPL
jgi:protein ImuA